MQHGMNGLCLLHEHHAPAAGRHHGKPARCLHCPLPPPPSLSPDQPAAMRWPFGWNASDALEAMLARVYLKALTWPSAILKLTHQRNLPTLVLGLTRIERIERPPASPVRVSAPSARQHDATMCMPGTAQRREQTECEGF